MTLYSYDIKNILHDESDETYLLIALLIHISWWM